MRFILSIDTEGDNQWDYGRELTTENIRYIPRFQEFCDNYHIKPTPILSLRKFAIMVLLGRYSKDYLLTGKGRDWRSFTFMDYPALP